MSTMRLCKKHPHFRDHIPFGSICSGWGVAEMVLNAINDRLALDGAEEFPKAIGDHIFVFREIDVNLI